MRGLIQVRFLKESQEHEFFFWSGSTHLALWKHGSEQVKKMWSLVGDRKNKTNQYTAILWILIRGWAHDQQKHGKTLEVLAGNSKDDIINAKNKSREPVLAMMTNFREAKWTRFLWWIRKHSNWNVCAWFRVSTNMNFFFPTWLLAGTPFSDRGKGYFKKKAKYNGSEYGSPLELNGRTLRNLHITMKKHL